MGVAVGDQKRTWSVKYLLLEYSYAKRRLFLSAMGSVIVANINRTETRGNFIR